MKASAPPSLPTFESLMLPHLDAAYNLARWLLRDPHRAEDAVQDAILRAHRAFGRFTGSDAKPWLLCIVRNVCYSHLRQLRREPTAEAFDEDAHGSTEDYAQEKALKWQEAKAELLSQALDRLSAEFREVIVLHELEGLGYREIAAVAEIPIGTVMSRLARARQKLKTEVRAIMEKDVSNEL